MSESLGDKNRLESADGDGFIDTEDEDSSDGDYAPGAKITVSGTMVQQAHASNPLELTDLSLVRELKNQSLGDVANQFQERKLAKAFRVRTDKAEINNFDGAGIIPCTMIDGKLHLLLQQPKRGKKSGVRWHDFGGKKRIATESPTECACRKFTKYTYGLFSIETDWSADEIMKEVQEIYGKHKEKTWPLLLQSGLSWCKMWMQESDACSFYNAQCSYHLYLMPVPFIAADVFYEVSELVDQGKREFQWIPHDIVSAGPLAARLQSRALFRQMGSLEIQRLIDIWAVKEDVVRPNTFDVVNTAYSQSPTT